MSQVTGRVEGLRREMLDVQVGDEEIWLDRKHYRGAWYNVAALSPSQARELGTALIKAADSLEPEVAA
jgi:lipocalin